MLSGLVRGISVVLAPLLALGQPEAELSEVPSEEVPSVEECVGAHEEAQLYREDADLVAARDALRVCASTSCPKLIQRDCVFLLAEIQRALPSVVVDVVIEGQPGAPEHFWIDGKLSKVPRDPVEMNPGLHRFRARHVIEGEEVDLVLEVVVQPSARRQVVRIDLHKAAPDPASLLIDTGRPLRIAGFSTLGAAGAVGVATLGVGVDAFLRRDKAREECAPACSADRVNRIEAGFLAADILGATAGALAVSAIVMIIVGYGRRPRVESEDDGKGRKGRKNARIRVDPLVALPQAGLRIRW